MKKGSKKSVSIAEQTAVQIAVTLRLKQSQIKGLALIIQAAIDAATAESEDTAIVDWFEKRGSTSSFWKQSCPQHDGSIKTGWINNFTHNRAMDSMQPTFREAVTAARQQERSQK